MQGNNYFESGEMWLSTLIEKDFVLTSVGGEEIYQLTRKEDGTVFLISFESRYAANRWKAENTEYFIQQVQKNN